MLAAMKNAKNVNHDERTVCKNKVSVNKQALLQEQQYESGYHGSDGPSNTLHCDATVHALRKQREMLNKY